MTRIIKRYGSRKLYDTANSRYILLEDIAELVREGAEIQVVDNKTGEDVTAQTLTQVISEEGRKKNNLLSSELLHDLIRAGETAMNNHIRQIQDGMDRFMKRSLDRLVPVRHVREEMSHLRARLDELESNLTAAEKQREQKAKSAPAESPVKAEAEPKPAPAKKAAPKRAPRKTTARKTTARKAAPKTATAKSTASKTAAPKKTTARKAAPRKTTTRAPKTTATAADNK
jgi:polyhydroxyalkanoate synthesis repressor PhaR